MKKLLIAMIFILSATVINSFASEIPDFVSIGINASSLAQSVSLEADGGIYTEAIFAMPEAAQENGEASEGGEGAESGEITEGSSFYIADSIEVTVSENGTLVCNGKETDETEVEFLKTSEFIVCQGKKYRGAIRLSVRHGKILIISVVHMDEYLYGVVGKEMSDSFPLEALKAQSVAARNYAVISMRRHESEGFNLCNGVHCQAYGAVASEGSNVRQAVDETTGKLLYYNGEVVECYYYSSNGGYTESSENVWVSEIGYLRGKADPFEDGSRIPGYNWEVTFTAEEIKTVLDSRGIDIGDIVNVEVTDYSENNHVTAIKIEGTKGEKVYYKDNIRAAFPGNLRSTYFTVSSGAGEASVRVLTGNGMETVKIAPSYIMSGNGILKVSGKGREGEFTFSGSGYGHGVGMSQYGAYFMAEQGYTYEDILKFYYTDTEIKGYES